MIFTVIVAYLVSNINSQRLVTWQGESYNKPSIFSHINPSNPKLTNTVQKELIQLQRSRSEMDQIISDTDFNLTQMILDRQESWIETVSWSPRAFVYHNFLTEAECKHLIKLASRQLKRSAVGSKEGGEVSNTRTSYGMFIRRLHDEVVTKIGEKVENWTHLPLINHEDLQVLRYTRNQEYKPHYDSNGRIATVLLYLTDVEEGGETVFPSSSSFADPKYADQHGPFSECAQGHVAVKPRQGDALLFYSVPPGSNMTDPASKHRGCPVIEGVKYTGTVWIHAKPFRPETLGDPKEYNDPGFCIDLNEHCDEWARKGECKNNPDYMNLNCIQSCLGCQLCEKLNFTCRKIVREKLGYLTVDDDLEQLGIPLE